MGMSMKYVCTDGQWKVDMSGYNFSGMGGDSTATGYNFGGGYNWGGTRDSSATKDSTATEP
jgi:hypothetical protein